MVADSKCRLAGPGDDAGDPGSSPAVAVLLITVAIRVAIAVRGVPVSIRRGMSIAVGSTVRRGSRRAVALLAVQLFVDRLLGEPEDLANAFVEPFGLVDEGRVQFDLQIHAGPPGPVIVVGHLAADTDVRF